MGQPAFHSVVREDPLALHNTSRLTLSTDTLQSRELAKSSSADPVTRSKKDILIGIKNYSAKNNATVPDVRYRHDTIVDILKPLRTEYAGRVQALLDMRHRASQIMIDLQVQKRLSFLEQGINSEHSMGTRPLRRIKP